jgi:hypothetical protein
MGSAATSMDGSFIEGYQQAKRKFSANFFELNKLEKHVNDGIKPEAESSAKLARRRGELR